MKVLLVDVDSTIPNLALMKLSAWHKGQGDTVELIRLEVSYYPDRRKNKSVDNSAYDRTYASTVFLGTIAFVSFSSSENLVFGGTGINNENTLPGEVENCKPDYSIYPDNDTAYGFISRGCDRKCSFCGVPKKEGRVHQVENDVRNIIGDFKKVKFMDNNFLQLKNHLEILRVLIDTGVKFQFNQGLDFRLLTEENTALLRRANYMGEFIFAFDNWHYRKFYESRLNLINWMKPWQAKFYVYVHPKMPLYETVKRIEWLRDRQLLPYVMRDIACWGSENADFYVDIASYANQPAHLKKSRFFEYVVKRYTYANCAPNTDRITKSFTLYTEAMYAKEKRTIEVCPA